MIEVPKEQEEEFKTYVFAGDVLLAYLGAEQGETIQSVKLGESITVVTDKGVSPEPVLRRTYRISLLEARTLMSLAAGELFDDISYLESLTVVTRRRVL